MTDIMIITSMLLFDGIKVAGIKVVELDNLFDLTARFAVNLGVVLFIARYLYYSITRKKEYLFSYLVISTVVFFLCYLLESVDMELGLALGLFAIFGIIRYRTDAIPIKEMTYLFVVIGVSVINALASVKSGGVVIIVFANAAVIITTYYMEKVWLLHHESTKTIVYDKIALVKPENYSLLVKDLQERTGITTITRVDVGNFDLMKETCSLTIHYKEK